MGSQISSNKQLNSIPIETRTYLLASHASMENQSQTKFTGTEVDTPPPQINKNDEGDNPKTASASIVLVKSDIIDYSRKTKLKNYKEKLESVANDLLNVIGRLNELRETSGSCDSFSTIQSQLNCVHTKLVNRAMAGKPKKSRHVNKTLRYKVVSRECPKVILEQKLCDQQCNNPITEPMAVLVESSPNCEQNEVYCNNIREETVVAVECAAPFQDQINQCSVQCNKTIKTPQNSSHNHLNCKPIETRTYLLADHASMENQHQSKFTGAAVDTPLPHINQNDEGDNPKMSSANMALSQADIVDCSRKTKSKNYKENLESVANDLLNVIERLNEVQQTSDCNIFSTIQSQLNSLHTKLVDRAMAGKPQKLRKKNKSCHKNICTGQLIDCDLRTLRDKVDSREYPKVILNQTFGDQQRNSPIREEMVASVESAPTCEQNKVYYNNIREVPPTAVESAACLENQINQYSVQSDRIINSSNNAPLYRSKPEPRRLSFTGPAHYVTINHQDKNKAPSPAIINNSLLILGDQNEMIDDMDFIFAPQLSSTAIGANIDQAPFETSIQQSGQYGYGMTSNSIPQAQNQRNDILIATGPAEYAQRQNQTNNCPVAADPMKHSQHQNPANNVLIETGPAEYVEYVEHQNQTNNVLIAACPMNQSQRQNQTNNVPMAAGSMEQSQCQNQTNNFPMAAVAVEQSQCQTPSNNVPMAAGAMEQSLCQTPSNNVPMAAIAVDQSQCQNPSNNVPMATCSMEQSQCQNPSNNVPMAAGAVEQSQCQNQPNNVPMAEGAVEQPQCQNQPNNVLMAISSVEQSQCQNQTNKKHAQACQEACPMNQSQCQNQTNNVSKATSSPKQSTTEQLHDSNQTLAIHDLIIEASKTIPFNIAEVENFFNVIGGLKGRLGWKNLLLVVVENIRTFTAVKIFNKVTFQEVGHFNLSAAEMRSVYDSGLLELFQYIKNLNTLHNPYALEQFRSSTVRLILQEQDDPERRDFLPPNKSAADLQYYQNCTLEPQSYIDFSGINRRTS